MIVLFTDFGWADPYLGQIKARLAALAPGQAVNDLLHNAPDFNPHAGAHLLAALCRAYLAGAVFITIVDPGVGTPRDAVVVEADGQWFVGPDNGLISVVAARASSCRVWRIVWRPDTLSSTFHGRDLFPVIAAALAESHFPGDKLELVRVLQIAFDDDDLARVIYIDHYGNAWTGVRGRRLSPATRVEAAGHVFCHAHTFAEVEKGGALWFVNSAGLLELAVNQGSVAARFGLKIGDSVKIQSPT
jgi:S-adenosylmethionine hydrolase